MRSVDLLPEKIMGVPRGIYIPLGVFAVFAVFGFLRVLIS